MNAQSPRKFRGVQLMSESSPRPVTYTFQIALLQADGSGPCGDLQPWQTGTLDVSVDGDTASGALTIPFYPNPIPLSGTADNGSQTSFASVSMTGSSPDSADTSVSFFYQYDGFLASCSYLGGIAQILDNSAQETYTYELQGGAPQGPFAD